MVARIMLCLVLATSWAEASRGVEVHAHCAAELAKEPAHLRTLRAELAQALADMQANTGYKLDASLVHLGSKTAGNELEVRAEVRAFLSDERGQIKWSSTARST